MESIEIKNFGPIKHVKLDLKDINVFIGTTASGKSTVAKLVAIARNSSFATEISFDLFVEHLAKYNIAFKVTDKTYIRYANDRFYWELSHKNVKGNSANWLLSTVVTGFEQLLLLVMRRKYPSNESGSYMREQIQTFLIALSLLSGAEELVRMEYKEKGKKPPEQVQDLLSITEEYRKRLNSSDINDKKKRAIVEEFLNDSRLLHLLPPVGANMFDQTTYIPAERNLLAMVGQSIFGLMSNNVSIAETTKNFGSEFESARKQIKQLMISFLSAEYKFIDNNNVIVLPNGTETKLEQASSGFQSVVPLLLVIVAKKDKEEFLGKYFIIEEPELNLYPTVQKDLIEFIVERINKHRDKLIITTHSPYILTALDNLIQADNAVKANPEAQEKVKTMIPPERWVDFDRVTCYYFKDGKCQSTLDKEYRSIGPSNIDDVSIELSKTYDELLELKYADVL